jgi:hypothetical protein
MKKKLFLLLALQTLLFRPNAQEVEYFLSGVVTVGCNGGSPATDMTKKIRTVYTENGVNIFLKSINCEREYNLDEVKTIKGDNKVYYSKKSEHVLIKEGADKIYLYKKSGTSFSAIAGAHIDKNSAKATSAKDQLSTFKPLLDQIDGALVEMKKQEEERIKKEQEAAEAQKKKESLEKQMAERGEFYNQNVGKMFFTKNYRKTENTQDDNAASFITEYELGSGPLYVVTYFSPEMGVNNNGSINVKYSIGNVSVSSEELRALRGNEKGERYSGGVASASYFATGLAGFFPMVSAEGKYYDAAYSMAEDAFKVLLSRVESKLVKGSTHTVKVEFSFSKDIKDFSQPAFMTGEIKMKVTEKSENLLSRLCMCSAKAQDNPTIEAQVKSLFESDKTVQKVHRVYITDRDYNIETSYGIPTKRTIGVSVLFTSYDGWAFVWNGTVGFNYDGSKYSDIAFYNKRKFAAPISPTCLRGKM